MIKKTPKLVVGLLTLCLLWCCSSNISVYATTINQLLSGAVIINSDGSISVVAQTSRRIYYVNLDDTKSGTITLTYNNSLSGNIVFSSDDVPEDIQVGYTFISSDYTTLSGNAPISVNFSNVKYAYISSNHTLTCEVTYDGDTPIEPTPTFTPTPTSSAGGGYNLPYHWDMPLDYYLVAIIILLGGILICQLFKN